VGLSAVHNRRRRKIFFINFFRLTLSLSRVPIRIVPAIKSALRHFIDGFYCLCMQNIGWLILKVPPPPPIERCSTFAVFSLSRANLPNNFIWFLRWHSPPTHETAIRHTFTFIWEHPAAAIKPFSNDSGIEKKSLASSPPPPLPGPWQASLILSEVFLFLHLSAINFNVILCEKLVSLMTFSEIWALSGSRYRNFLLRLNPLQFKTSK
jgi:hypothetical protein